jgi:hypothetical protein
MRYRGRELASQATTEALAGGLSITVNMMDVFLFQANPAVWLMPAGLRVVKSDDRLAGGRRP